MTRRDLLTFKGDILLAISEGALDGVGPTAIMYHVNAAWRPLQAALMDLIDAGLVTEKAIPKEKGAWKQYRPRRRRRLYGLTQQGYLILRYYRGFKRALATTQAVKDILEKQATT